MSERTENGWKTWVITALMACFLTIGGIAAGMAQARIAAEEATRKGQDDVLLQGMILNRERIAANEATVKAINDTLNKIDTNLNKLVQMHMKE
jgi:flavin-dependent dehydrogenase